MHTHMRTFAFQDKYVLTQMSILIACCVWHAVVSILSDEPYAKLADRIALGVLGGLYLLLQLTFVLYWRITVSVAYLCAILAHHGQCISALCSTVASWLVQLIFVPYWRVTVNAAYIRALLTFTATSLEGR